jgi:hypothetical protein
VKKPKNKAKIKTINLTIEPIPFFVSFSDAKNLSKTMNIK